MPALDIARRGGRLISRHVQRRLGLPAPSTRDLTVQRGLAVPLRDGTQLVADRWLPREGPADAPVAVMRIPYSRGGLNGQFIIRPLVERGFQALVISTRGEFGSTGSRDVLRQEREDGIDALAWVAEQEWFPGSMVLVGQSYGGYTQWAVADALPPSVSAIIPASSSASVGMTFIRPDAPQLENPFFWGCMLEEQERRLATLRMVLSGRRWTRAMATIPVIEADRAALGRESPLIRSFFEHDAASAYWAPVDRSAAIADVRVPVSAVAGWSDVFLAEELRDFRTLQRTGCEARLTIGPWSHTDEGISTESARQALEFGLPHARGEEPAERAAVRLYVMGLEQWRDVETWPPPGYAPRDLFLGADGGLTSTAPGTGGTAGFRYDPSDPTPAVGGALMRPGTPAGPVDNAALESRDDVLTFTSPPLRREVEVIGDVTSSIWFSTSAESADVFVRLCDVDPRGTSTNITDGITGDIRSQDAQRVSVDLAPTAYRFCVGHRIRVQVSSGAYPQFMRNPGTGRPRRTATTYVAADQTVHHGGSTPSSLTVPRRVIDDEGDGRIFADVDHP